MLLIEFLWPMSQIGSFPLGKINSRCKIFSWVCKSWLVAIILLITFGNAQPAQALPAGASALTDTSFGICTLQLRIDGAGGHAQVRVSLGLFNRVYAGGTYWNAGAIANANALTPDFIENTCELTNVSNFTSKGADAPSFAAEDDMFVRFRATDRGNVFDFSFELTAAGVPIISRVRSDTTAPSLSSITGLPSSITTATTFDATFTFSEDITGFEIGDLTIGNGTVNSIAGGPSVYTVNITASGTGDLTLALPAGVVQDSGANANTAFDTVTVASSNAEETTKEIDNFISSRTANLVANQPVFTNFLTGTGGGLLNADVTRSAGELDFQTDASGQGWARFKGTWSEIGSNTSNYALLAVGRHTRISENFLVGGMLQVDYAKTSSGVASTQGTGWLLGGYLVAKHTSQPLYFEASAMAGKTENKTSPLGTYTDSFSSNRYAIGGRVTGEIDYPQVIWRPSLAVSHTVDSSESYVDSNGTTIGAQKVQFTELAAMLSFAKPVDWGWGDTQLTGGLSSRYYATSGLSNAQESIFENTRSRVDLGFVNQGTSGVNTSFTVFYDGLFAPQFKSAGLDLRVDFSF